MIFIPIRTESAVYRAPVANYALIAANMLAFLVLNNNVTSDHFQMWLQQHAHLHAHAPRLHQFITYQFLHADGWHLLSNMLFLWVFGTSVNGKMGHGAYVLFYLAGGAFAGWGFALFEFKATLIGASGAIAAVTAAYLALFPRSRVTVLLWLFIFIHFIEIPAMLLILFKVIVWDNVISPGLFGSGGVAHTAHLAGYLFGFVGAIGMLLARGVPRDQFDMLALWKRWHRRRAWAGSVSQAGAADAGVAQTHASPQQQREEDRRADRIAEWRTQITDALDQTKVEEAAALYEDLIAEEPQQCLSERNQLAVARQLYSTGRLPQAASAFHRYVECYPDSSEATNVRLLLGIIYARDLQQFEVADEHLTRSLSQLRDERRRSQCLEWLRTVRTALGRAVPEG